MCRKKVDLAAIVIDTSCFIWLWQLGLLPKLPSLYSVVHIPKYVLEEARRKGRSKRRLQEVLNDYGPLLKVCEVGSPYEVQILSDKRLKPKRRIDRGEAEAIVQARERGIPLVMIDDRQGRAAAERHSLNVIGTLGVLRQLKKIGVVAEIRPLLESLGPKFWLSEALLKKQLAEVDEEW
jgi:hypothetical protein